MPVEPRQKPSKTRVIATQTITKINRLTMPRQNSYSFEDANLVKKPEYACVITGILINNNLKLMAFVRASGKPNIEYFPKTVSVAIANGALTYWISGGVNAADATSGDHIGICMKTVAATDADYAVATPIPIDVPGENDIFEVTCAATAVATNIALIGTYIDLTDSVTANPAASSKDALLLVGVISTTKLLVKIASRSNILRTATT